jgi:hypothetical protein
MLQTDSATCTNNSATATVNVTGRRPIWRSPRRPTRLAAGRRRCNVTFTVTARNNGPDAATGRGRRPMLLPAGLTLSTRRRRPAGIELGRRHVDDRQSRRRRSRASETLVVVAHVGTAGLPSPTTATISRRGARPQRRANNTRRRRDRSARALRRDQDRQPRPTPNVGIQHDVHDPGRQQRAQ